jgi:flagellar hook assembly protein FlgD
MGPGSADLYVTRLIPALLVAALLPLGTAPAVAASPDRSQPAPRAAAQVRILDTTSPFSPDGDGHRDRLSVRYRLTETARVSVTVTHRGKTVLRTTPKVIHAGKRSLRWDGTRANGKHVADGRYGVVVRATAHGTTRTGRTTVVVRTSPTHVDAGALKLSSGTVYPYAKVINDVVVGNFNLTSPLVVDGLDGYYYPARVIEKLRAQVLDRAGRVVSTEPITSAPRSSERTGVATCDPCGRFTWDGRDAVGQRQAPGAYRIRVVQGRDAAGNTRIVSNTRSVKISRAQLEAKATVIDLDAAATPQSAEPPTGGCILCPYPCATTASTRYPDGLTFTTTSTTCLPTLGYFTVPVPGRRTPYDRFSVTATGGPSTPGASASAQLTAGADSRASLTMTGDTTTPSSDRPMASNSEIYPAGWPDAVLWSVRGREGSYDVASFQVRTLTYVPAA